MLARIHHHRRYTANHTWYLDAAGRHLFVKANPNRTEARRETLGHRRLCGRYPIPDLYVHGPLGRWYLHVYRRQPGVGTDQGMLLDLLAAADHAGPGSTAWKALQAAATALIGHYRQVIATTAAPVEPSRLETKLFADRAAPGGRLDTYYRSTRLAWMISPLGAELTIRDIPNTTLVINGDASRLDLPGALDQLRAHFTRSPQRVWAALTQGDPTGFNLGWTSEAGPFWFDYDTAGTNALAGEFAVFLVDVLLHGARLTPSTNPAAYLDHPAALADHTVGDGVQLRRVEPGLVELDMHYQPSLARRWLATTYLHELVSPTAAQADIRDVARWLRPWLLMRLLAVYHPADLHYIDALLLLATIIRVLNPDLDVPMTELFTVTAVQTDPPLPVATPPARQPAAPGDSR